MKGSQNRNKNSHLLSFNVSIGSSVGVEGSPGGLGSERSSKLIINNEISSTSERIGAVKGENIHENHNLTSDLNVLPITSEQRNF
jgi:hypothetical protein